MSVAIVDHDEEAEGGNENVVGTYAADQVIGSEAASASTTASTTTSTGGEKV